MTWLPCALPIHPLWSCRTAIPDPLPRPAQHTTRRPPNRTADHPQAARDTSLANIPRRSLLLLVGGGGEGEEAFAVVVVRPIFQECAGLQCPVAMNSRRQGTQEERVIKRHRSDLALRQGLRGQEGECPVSSRAAGRDVAIDPRQRFAHRGSGLAKYPPRVAIGLPWVLTTYRQDPLDETCERSGESRPRLLLP